MPVSGAGGFISGSRKGGLGVVEGRLTFQTVIMSDCCDRGTCLVRMA